jgi:hypothetical protein
MPGTIALIMLANITRPEIILVTFVFFIINRRMFKTIRITEIMATITFALWQFM